MSSSRQDGTPDAAPSKRRRSRSMSNASAPKYSTASNPSCLRSARSAWTNFKAVASSAQKHITMMLRSGRGTSRNSTSVTTPNVPSEPMNKSITSRPPEKYPAALFVFGHGYDGILPLRIVPSGVCNRNEPSSVAIHSPRRRFSSEPSAKMTCIAST